MPVPSLIRNSPNQKGLTMAIFMFTLVLISPKDSKGQLSQSNNQINLDNSTRHCSNESSRYQLVTVRRTNVQDSSIDSDNDTNDLQQAGSNRSNPGFQAPITSELVVEPIVPPFVNAVYQKFHRHDPHKYANADRYSMNDRAKYLHDFNTTKLNYFNHRPSEESENDRQSSDQAKNFKQRHDSIAKNESSNGWAPIQGQVPHMNAIQFVSQQSLNSHGHFDMFNINQQQQQLKPMNGFVNDQLNKWQNMSRHKPMMNGYKIGIVQDDRQANKRTQSGDLLPFERQRRFSWSYKNQHQQQPAGLEELQESVQQPFIDLEQPKDVLLSQYLLQQTKSRAQQPNTIAIQPNYHSPIEGPQSVQVSAGLQQHIVPNQFKTHSTGNSLIAGRPLASSLMTVAPQELLALQQPHLSQTPVNPIEGQRPPMDVGQDGTNMVAYSLLPSSLMADEQMNSSLGVEQLMNVLQQFTNGQQAQQVDTEQSIALNMNDAALVTLLDNMVKNAVGTNQNQVTIGQQQQQSQSSQTPSQQLQQPTTAPPNSNWPPQLMNQSPKSSPQTSSSNLIETQARPIGMSQLAPPSSHTSPHQMPPPPSPPISASSTTSSIDPAALYYDTDHTNSHLDPTAVYAYGAPPRKRPKKKGKRPNKYDGSKGPIVRVQKRPRVSHNGQQFYDMNSPNDMQPSATLHKWKYPWLYNDDDDEEEGETEINLRFFNNFSRMGPLGGLARSVAPATFIVSLAFLILSNISLAATVIVHGISSFLRNFSQNQTSQTGPGRLSGRVARLLDFETTTPAPRVIGGSLSTIPKPTKPQGRNHSAVQPHKLTTLDHKIKSLVNAWT